MLKGWFGETKTAFWMKLTLSTELYKRVHNVIIPSQNGTTQIDHILVSPYGIFIIETKNYTGWIFGSSEQKNWTQVIYGKKYYFQNPLRQTYRQKKVLADFLGLEEHTIHDIVSFVGDCRFKTDLPRNVIKHGLSSHIKSYKSIEFSSTEVISIINRLELLKSNSMLSKKDHIRSLKDRHHSSTNCPKCGADLVTRTARMGANAGSEFLGCSNFPKCRFTKNK